MCVVEDLMVRSTIVCEYSSIFNVFCILTLVFFLRGWFKFEQPCADNVERQFSSA